MSSELTIEEALCFLIDKQVLPKSAVAALRLISKKSLDYNSKVGREAYFPMGVTSYAQMVHIKSLRLVNLSMSKEAPNFESVEDSAADLFNYTIFLLDFLDRRKQNEDS